jgi:tyrosine-protein kinase Etk/Wzc
VNAEPTTQHESSTPQDGAELPLTEYLLILVDEWRTLAVPLFLVLIGAVAYLLVVVPRYSSSGIVQVSTQDTAGASALFDITGIGRPSPIETEVEILRSRSIVGAAVRRLGLNISQETPAYVLDLDVTLRGKSPVHADLLALRHIMRDVEIDDWIERGVSAVLSVAPDGSLRAQIAGRPPATVRPGERYDGDGVHFRVVASDPQWRPKAAVAVNLVPEDMVVQSLRERLSVEMIGGRKETNLVGVSMSYEDRAIARDLVNAILDEYLEFALKWHTERADKTAKFIEGQLEAVQQGLEVDERQLQSFLEGSGAVALTEQATGLVQGSAELELDLRKTRIQEDLLSLVSSEMSRAEREGGPIALSGDFLADDELLGQSVGALNELEMKRETLLAEATMTHPEVRRLDEEIRRVRGQVHELIQASRDRIRERRHGITKALDDIQGELSAFPDKERQMAALRRKLDVSQELYTFLLTKLEESRITRASTTTDKRIVDLATTAPRAERPKRGTTAMLALVVGIIVGIAAVFLRRALDPKVRDEDEAKGIARIPVYGVVPNLKVLGLVSGRHPILERVWDAPKGPGAESFRTLRTNVEFAQVGDKRLQVVQVTSSEPGEGKSTILSNLAVALAKAGHRVLIVDLDLRRPVQHRFWSVPRAPGLTDHLVGRAALSVAELAQWGVRVVSAGHEPPESQRLLASENLAALMAGWRAAYDYVLLDTPPLLVADSLVISRLSDMVLFVVRPRWCRRAAIKMASQTCRKMALVRGLVINGALTRRGGYYHYYRGSYYGSKTTDTQES